MAFDRDKFINSLVQSLSTERISQKEIYRRAYDYLNCNSRAHLDEALEDFFSDYETKKTTILFRELGATKSIVDNISLVYSEQPERTFTINDKEIEDEYLSELYEKIGNSFFQEYEKLVNGLSHCSVLVEWDEESEAIDLRILTPDKYDVIVDDIDYTKPRAFYYQVSTQDDMTNKSNVTSFYYVDRENMSKVIVGIKYGEDDIVKNTSVETVGLNGSNKEKNPYGIIPIVTTTSKKQVNDFFVDQNARLFESSEKLILIKDVSSNDAAFYQGFDIYVHTKNMQQTAVGHGVSDGVKIAPDTVLNIDSGVAGSRNPEKFERLGSNTDLGMLNQDMKDVYLQLASIFGLGESDGNVKVNQSGISLVVSDGKKNKLINANRPTYRTFENKLFEVIKIVNNKHSRVKINENVKISVDFKEIETSIGVTDKIDWQAHEMDYELKPKYMILMDDNPELTEELAKEQIRLAADEKKELNKSITAMNDAEDEEME